MKNVFGHLSPPEITIRRVNHQKRRGRRPDHVDGATNEMSILTLAHCANAERTREKLREPLEHLNRAMRWRVALHQTKRDPPEQTPQRDSFFVPPAVSFGWLALRICKLAAACTIPVSQPTQRLLGRGRYGQNRCITTAFASTHRRRSSLICRVDR